jgi:hypothetical protein
MEICCPKSVSLATFCFGGVTEEREVEMMVRVSLCCTSLAAMEGLSQVVLVLVVLYIHSPFEW